ncbi:hypothetical protein C4544_03870, partial [candidate division WS5 bacterium]
MEHPPKNCIAQYKLLFYLSWIVLYFIFPAWRFEQIYISFTGETIQAPFAPVRILMTYFFVSAVLLNYFFKSLSVNKPLIINFPKWSELVINNFGLVLVCCSAAVLHLAINSPVKTGAAVYSIWIYNFISRYWQNLFNLPIQFPIWLFIFLVVLFFKQKGKLNLISRHVSLWYSLYKSNYLIKLLFMAVLFFIFIMYSRHLPYYHWRDHLYITGYPPLGTLLYLIVYLTFGTGNVSIAPVLVQFSFYI